MNRLLLALAVTLGSLVYVANAGASASTFTVSANFDVELTVFVPCANDGVGEFVALTGSLHDVLHGTEDGAGGFHVRALENPQGVSGTGLSTGDKYRGTGVTQSNFTAKASVPETFVDNFRIIGQGSGVNLLLHENFHVTVNPDGQLTASHDNFSVTCG